MGGHVCVFAVPTGSDKVVGSQGRGGGQVPVFRWWPEGTLVGLADSTLHHCSPSTGARTYLPANWVLLWKGQRSTSSQQHSHTTAILAFLQSSCLTCLWIVGESIYTIDYYILLYYKRNASVYFADHKFGCNWLWSLLHYLSLCLHRIRGCTICLWQRAPWWVKLAPSLNN